MTSEPGRNCAVHLRPSHQCCPFSFLNNLTNYNIKCRCCKNSTFHSKKCAFVFWGKLKSSPRNSLGLPSLHRFSSATTIAFSLLFALKTTFLFPQTFLFSSYAAPKKRTDSVKIANTVQYVSVCALKGLKSESKIFGSGGNVQHIALRL